MNTIMNKEIQKSPPPSPPVTPPFRETYKTNRPNKRSRTPRAYITLPLAHTPNQSVPVLFAKTFPLALPACLPARPPVRPSNPLPRAFPGYILEGHSEYSDLSTPPPVPEEVRGGFVRVWLTERDPPFLK